MSPEVSIKHNEVHQVSYPVGLEGEVENKERGNAKDQAQQRCLVRGLEVWVGVGACIHPTVQGSVFLHETKSKSTN